MYISIDYKILHNGGNVTSYAIKGKSFVPSVEPTRRTAEKAEKPPVEHVRLR